MAKKIQMKRRVFHVLKNFEELPAAPPLITHPIRKNFSFCGERIEHKEPFLQNPIHAAKMMASNEKRIMVCPRCIKAIKKNRDNNPIPEVPTTD